jgi:hypothetical protein
VGYQGETWILVPPGAFEQVIPKGAGPVKPPRLAGRCCLLFLGLMLGALGQGGEVKA